MTRMIALDAFGIKLKREEVKREKSPLTLHVFTFHDTASFFRIIPPMAATLIDGAAQAAAVRKSVRERVEQLKGQGRAVQLTAILVGSTPAAEVYAENQARTSAAVGINYRLLKLPAEASMEDVRTAIEKLNHDTGVTGIMLHLPLPEHLDAT